MQRRFAGLFFYSGNSFPGESSYFLLFYKREGVTNDEERPAESGNAEGDSKGARPGKTLPKSRKLGAAKYAFRSGAAASGAS